MLCAAIGCQAEGGDGGREADWSGGGSQKPGCTHGHHLYREQPPRGNSKVSNTAVHMLAFEDLFSVTT